MRGYLPTLGLAAVWVALSMGSVAQAQWDETVDDTPAPAAAQAAVPADTSAGPRLAFQGRLIANMFGTFDVFVPSVQPSVAVGARFADNRVFAGVGLNVFGLQDEFHGVAVTPTITFDVLAREVAALYLVGWVPLGVIVFPGLGPGSDRDTTTLVGANLGLGARAQVHEALAIGAEWGWGFGVLLNDEITFSGDNTFFHGAFGALMLEVSIGL
jgi:hypothetical protein